MAVQVLRARNPHLMPNKGRKAGVTGKMAWKEEEKNFPLQRVRTNICLLKGTQRVT